MLLNQKLTSKHIAMPTDLLPGFPLISIAALQRSLSVEVVFSERTEQR